jgi:hypothetical protein
MAAIWAARVGSMEGDCAAVIATAENEKRAAARVFRIAFMDIGSILRAGQRTPLPYFVLKPKYYQPKDVS